jgi:cell division protein FtsW
MRRETVLLMNVVLALVCIGILMVYSAGTVRGFPDSSEEGTHSLAMLLGQAARAGIGFALMLAAASFDYHRFRERKILWSLAFVTLTLLVLVVVLAEARLGARRWLSIGGVSLQPSDIAKVMMIILLAVKLSENQAYLRSFWRGFAPPMAVAGAFAFLVMLERDIGTPFLMGLVALMMAAMAGARWFHIAVSVLPGAAIGAVYVALNPHAQSRLLAYRNPGKYSEDEGFQLLQSLWAFSRGGLTGVGPGASQQKMSYLPEAHSDFIFAVVGEELGLVGAVVVVVLFAVFAMVAIRIARCAPDTLGALLAAGLASMISMQAMLSMGVTTGMLPTKGLTMPFISAGGTSLIANMAMAGILLNVARQAAEPEPVRRAAPARRAGPGRKKTCES